MNNQSSLITESIQNSSWGQVTTWLLQLSYYRFITFSCCG